MPVVGLDSSLEVEQFNSGDEIFMITALEIRFDPSYAVETSMGYRDLALCVFCRLSNLVWTNLVGHATAS